MHRRKDNYSDGPKYSRHNIRNHSFKQSNLSSNSNLASSSDRLSHDKSKYQSIRVVQKNMIHVVGFPQNLKSQNIASEEYFGMYGNVQKYSMTPIITRCKGKSKIYSYNAFITYTDEIESSLAIVALDGKTIGERLLKVSFGTTKYCSFFIKGSDCPNIRECLFLHEHQEDNELMIDEENMKAVYKEQLRVAVKVVKENLEKVLSRKKLVDMRGRKIRSDFPTIEETLNCLVAMKVIDKSMIEDKEEGKKNSSYDNKQPSLTIPISTSNNNLSPNIPNSNNHRKSVSNISISTEFSHSKQLKNKYNFKRQSSASLQKQRNKSRGKSAGRWGSKGKNPTENDKNEINRLINKLIVEKIMAKKDNHQRSRFAPLQPPKDRKCSEKIKYLLCKELLFESETNP